MELKERIKQARVEYLKRTDHLLKELCVIRMNQTIKYVYDYVNNTLDPIVHQTIREKEVIRQLNLILEQIKKEFNL